MTVFNHFIHHILAGGEGILLSVRNPVVGHQLYVGWGRKASADFEQGPFPLFSVMDWQGEQAHHWHWEHFDSINFSPGQGRLREVEALENLNLGLELEDLASLSPETAQSFAQKVTELQARQRAGEAWVANLTHPLSGELPPQTEARTLALLGFYNFLKLGQNHCGGVVITNEQLFCSFSPETFLLQDGPVLKTFPIKGTGTEAELKTSSKEISELHMITDLMRNDLGQISQRVRVERERYLTPEHGFYHARAEIHGHLADTKLPSGSSRVLGRELKWEDYKSLLPAGSISGAPKHRVLQILSELESFDRQFYTGTFGVRLNAEHGLFNILIRTLFIDESAKTWRFPVGAGITIKSDPTAEWEETLRKAEILRQCLG